ncbi:hypothetical protein BDZ89DRAFT_1041992 [Hymenopellis radicata]|nr:hypothetical protein BDZ89DRAFT_1041992 [Hymenopellis radicata]
MSSLVINIRQMGATLLACGKPVLSRGGREVFSLGCAGAGMATSGAAVRRALGIGGMMVVFVAVVVVIWLWYARRYVIARTDHGPCAALDTAQMIMDKIEEEEAGIDNSPSEDSNLPRLPFSEGDLMVRVDGYWANAPDGDKIDSAAVASAGESAIISFVAATRRGLGYSVVRSL